MRTERRLHPRLPVQLPVRLLVATDQGTAEYAAESINLSRSGIQVQCAREAAEALAAQAEFPPSCRLCLQRPAGEGVIDTGCRLIVSRRIAQDVYHLGFNFIALSAADEQALAACLAAGFAKQAPPGKIC